MNFKVTYKTENGSPAEKFVDAADKFAVIRELKKDGIVPLKITEGSKSHFNVTLFEGKIKTAEKVFFAKNLSSMLNAGLAISRALAVIDKQTKHQKLKKIVESLNTSIAEGKTLH